MESIKTRLKTYHSKVTLLTLCGLLFLRIPFLGGVGYFMQDHADWGEMKFWVDAWFQVGTYLLIAWLIWWEKNNLPEFHIDKFSLGIIVLMKPIQTLMITSRAEDHPLALPNLPGLSLWGISIMLVVTLWSHREALPQFQIRSLKTFGIGMLVGFGVSVTMSFPLWIQMNNLPFPVTRNKVVILGEVIQMIPTFFFQLGYAAVSEEPLFRGFLWGYLLKVGWRNVWIWIFQAVLFTIAHIYYIDELPISFGIVVPFGALVFGLLAWRYRSITPVMAAHGFSNAAMMSFALILYDLLK